MCNSGRISMQADIVWKSKRHSQFNSDSPKMHMAKAHHAKDAPKLVEYAITESRNPVMPSTKLTRKTMTL